MCRLACGTLFQACPVHTTLWSSHEGVCETDSGHVQAVESCGQDTYRTFFVRSRFFFFLFESALVHRRQACRAKIIPRQQRVKNARPGTMNASAANTPTRYPHFRLLWALTLTGVYRCPPYFLRRFIFLTYALWIGSCTRTPSCRRARRRKDSPTSTPWCSMWDRVWSRSSTSTSKP